MPKKLVIIGIALILTSIEENKKSQELIKGLKIKDE